ncbi:amino acid adenylation domain-containing protein [Nonomuraea sp. NPDC049486]|uniref:amino acid adenylation domain-containing protein n=1 Tax=Nonomuraea sp. NPDC049486 TaxID=3155773 RepID=UPI00342AFB3A
MNVTTATLLHELVTAQAARTPDAPAVRQWDTSLTYRGLTAAAGALAHRLRELGAGPETRIGVCGRRTPELLVSVLGVLMSGAAYVPLDPSHPRKRLETVIGDAGITLVVADQAGRGVLRDLPLRLVAPAQGELPPPEPAAAAEGSAAYVLYTSGSTGRPKGVVVSHASAVAFVTMAGAYFGLDASCRSIGFAALGFDVSVLDIFAPLARGGCVMLTADEDRVDPVRLQRFLERHRVTWGTIPPALLPLLDPDRLPALRDLLTAGEPAGPEQVARWSRPGRRRFHNWYGPTETTVCVVGTELDGDWDRPLPIGHPLPGCTAYILDDLLRPVPPGTPGELCVGGPQLARGYLHRPGLTAERFVPDPYGEPGARLYRTGDRVVLDAEGRIGFIGRLDRQVKVQGQRVEIGEIEVVLRAHPEIRQAVVDAGTGAGGLTELVAYLTPQEAPDLERVRAHCLDSVPAYMVPTRVLRLPALPLTPAGKVDLAALRTLGDQHTHPSSPEVTTEESGHRHAHEETASTHRTAPPTARDGEPRTAHRAAGDGEHRTPSPVADQQTAPREGERRTARRAAGDGEHRTPSPVADQQTASRDGERRSAPRVADGEHGAGSSAARDSDHLGGGEVMVREVAGAWGEAFGGAEPLADDDFFARGGHSLLAMRLTALLRTRLGRELAVEDVLAGRTVAGIARRAAAAPPLREEPPGDGPAALSAVQRRMWFVERLAPGTPAHNIAMAQRLTGPLDVAALRRALASVAERHEVLRWRVPQTGGVPSVTVTPPGPVPLPVEDVTDAELRERLQAEARLAFDLAEGPLWRARLLRLARDEHVEEHVLVVTVHHLVFDGWSQKVLYEDISRAYRQEAFPPLRATYGGYVDWLGRRDGEADLAWWSGHLDGAPTVLDLPRDHPRPPVQTFDGESVTAEAGAGVSAAVRELAARLGGTPYAVLLAAYGQVLRRLSGQPDLIVGTPVADRRDPALDPVAGCLVQVLPVRLRVDDGAPFSAHVTRCQEALSGALAHLDVRLERLVDRLGPGRDLSRNPLVQVLFNMYDFTEPRLDLPGVAAAPLPPGLPGSLFDLTLYVGERDGCYVLQAVYNPRLFRRSRVDALLHGYLRLLTDLTADPARPVRESRLRPRPGRGDEGPLPDPAEVKPLTLAGAASAGGVEVAATAGAQTGVVGVGDVAGAAEVQGGEAFRDGGASAGAQGGHGVWGGASPDVSTGLMDASGAVRLPDGTAVLSGWDGAGVVERVLMQVAGGPERVAVSGEDGELTYADLSRLADAAGAAVRAGETVAILAERTRELPALMLGVLAAGARWAVLDTALPPARLAAQARAAGATSIIACPGIQIPPDLAWLPPAGEPRTPANGEEGPAALAARNLTGEEGAAGPGVLDGNGEGESVDLAARKLLGEGEAGSDVLNGSGDRVVAVTNGSGDGAEAAMNGSGDRAEVGSGQGGTACRVVAMEERGYLAFTSGTTGEPKPVRTPERPLARFLDWYPRAYGLTGDDRFALLAGLAHDPLLRDAFTPLVLGATLHVPGPDLVRDPAKLAGWLRGRRITVAHLTPQLAALIAAAGVQLPDLRLVLFGGDRLTHADAARFRRVAPDARLVNAYGTTETPQAQAVHEIGDPPDHGDPVPAGHGVDGAELLVLDAAGAPAAVGELGEVVVRSRRLAESYLDETLTRERFARERDGETARYRTGDLGRYDPDGRVVLAGRADGQVKIRGYRVELGEVEAALLAHPGVRAAAATVAERPGGRVPLAYAVTDGPAVGQAELRRHLAASLPGYALPAELVLLPALPLTPNGKVDRARLPAPPPRPAPASGQEPATGTERLVAGVWREVLGLPSISAGANFFEIGGHSLATAQVQARLAASLGREVPIVDLFRFPTVRDLAAHLDGERRPAGWDRAARRVAARRARSSPHRPQQPRQESNE